MAKTIDFTQPLSAEDAAYAQDRPWLLQDAELNGIEIQFADDDEEEEEEDDDEGDNYDDLAPADLQREIKDRNEQPDRNPDTAVRPESNSKANLIAALRADDARSAE